MIRRGTKAALGRVAKATSSTVSRGRTVARSSGGRRSLPPPTGNPIPGMSTSTALVPRNQNAWEFGSRTPASSGRKSLPAMSPRTRRGMILGGGAIGAYQVGKSSGASGGRGGPRTSLYGPPGQQGQYY